jgi:TatD DNase family protein
MFTDTHAHLCWPDFAGDLPQIIERARAAGVTRIVTIGTSLENAQATLDLAGKYDGVYAAVGLHPGDVPVPAASLVQSLPVSPKLVAIGETGLDYYRLVERASTPVHSSTSATGETPVPLLKQQQRALFQAHLDLARQRRLPVVIHNREAEADMRVMLRANVPDWRPWGVMHCFAGSEAFAHECLDLGLLISFAGILTFKNASQLRTIAGQVPLDSILLETDAPYLAPVPHRGKRNESSYIPLIAAALAEVKGVPVEEIARVTTANAARLFRWT